MTATVPEIDASNLDSMSAMLVQTITQGVEELNAANEEIFAAEKDGTTSVRDIDKALKDASSEDGESDLPDDVLKVWAKAEKARQQYKDYLTQARNLYRTNVLGEEEVQEADVDKDALHESRNVTQNAVKMLITLAQSNKNTALLKWANEVEIPQVGRKGTSTVGKSKPRKYVSVDGVVHDNFGEAAKAIGLGLSSEDEKVTVTAGELAKAWSDAGEPEAFDFRGFAVTVKDKPKKSAG